MMTKRRTLLLQELVQRTRLPLRLRQQMEAPPPQLIAHLEIVQQPKLQTPSRTPILTLRQHQQGIQTATPRLPPRVSARTQLVIPMTQVAMEMAMTMTQTLIPVWALALSLVLVRTEMKEPATAKEKRTEKEQEIAKTHPHPMDLPLPLVYRPRLEIVRKVDPRALETGTDPKLALALVPLVLALVTAQMGLMAPVPVLDQGLDPPQGLQPQARHQDHPQARRPHPRHRRHLSSPEQRCLVRFRCTGELFLSCWDWFFKFS
ncbi:hypothetical protein BDV06DRAFT_207734 [Aspergillus oleicola]